MTYLDDVIKKYITPTNVFVVTVCFLVVGVGWWSLFMMIVADGHDQRWNTYEAKIDRMEWIAEWNNSLIRSVVWTPEVQKQVDLFEDKYRREFTAGGDYSKWHMETEYYKNMGEK